MNPGRTMRHPPLPDRSRSVLLLGVGLLLAAGCGDGGHVTDPGGPGGTAPVASVAVAPDSALLHPGERLQAVATPRDAAGNALGGRRVEWASSSPGVAAVDSAGLITAVAPGEAMITAASEGLSGRARVIVSTQPAAAGDLFRVAAGQEHGCGLDAAGRAFCWGANWGGQVGDASTLDPRLAPVPLSGGHTFSGLAAGSHHTCGLRPDGGVLCWGDNSFGQLGTGTTALSRVPAAVAGAPAFVSITAGDYHTCGLTAAGAAYCWGSHLAGELGTGAGPPEQCPGATGPLPCSTRPVPVAGGHAFDRISAGHLFTCALSRDGGAYCWGMNSTGNLGTGNQQDRPLPAPVAGGHRFVALAAGAFHACGVAGGGAAFCWGLGELGVLGVGAAALESCTGPTQPVPCARTPRQVSGAGDYRLLAAGHFHTCALNAAGGLSCWGLNQGGQLALGPNGPEHCVVSTGIWPCSRVPVAAAAGMSFTQVVAGGYHTLGRSAGDTYAWGANWYGQLGIASTTDRAAPTRLNF
jgi:alpha-tubulin suppressor-like RCC1 family protein